MMIHVEVELECYWNTKISKPNHPIFRLLSRDRFMELHVRFRVGSNFKDTYKRVRLFPMFRTLSMLIFIQVEPLASYVMSINLSI